MIIQPLLFPKQEVCPEQKIVSFHAEAGFHLLEFRSRELFLRCVDRYTGEQYRYQ